MCGTGTVKFISDFVNKMVLTFIEACPLLNLIQSVRKTFLTEWTD